VKPVVPKSASGSTVQPCDQQADGASTIDSAEWRRSRARAPVCCSALALE
jgi:hypothetical protein